MNIVYISLIILFILWIVVNNRKKNKLRKKVIHVIDDNCARCGNCIRKCNLNVFELVQNEKGLHIEVKYPSMCSGCGDCINACKFSALEFVEQK